MTIYFIRYDEKSIDRRMMEARQTRRTIEWQGHQILLSDLPEDQNDAENPICQASCCNCQEDVWIFPTMQTSCQICGHDWHYGLWRHSAEEWHIPKVA